MSLQEPIRSRRDWPALLARPQGRAGIALLVLLVLLAAFGPVLAGGGAYELNPLERLRPPGAEHPLGTDHLGRDQLARVAAGARTTLSATLLIVGGALVISMAVGLIAGLSGGIVDLALMRVIDVILAIPDLVIALAVLGVLGPGFGNLLLALTVASWAYLGRLARIHVVHARDRPDIWADRLAGVSTLRIVAGHIVPHLAAQLSVVATLRVGGVVMSFAGLSFLGLGAEPGSAEWGAQLAEARIYMLQAPWMVLAPAGCILWTIAGTNLCADALRDGGAR